MKKLIMLILLALISISLSLFAQEDIIWEKCNDGLDGYYWCNLIEFENKLYETRLFYYSDDTAKTWKKSKKTTTNIYGETVISEHQFSKIFRFKDKLISYEGRGNYSDDGIYWERFQITTSDPSLELSLKDMFSTGSTLLIRVNGNLLGDKQHRTYITTDANSFIFEKVETDLPSTDIVLEYQMRNDTVFATTDSPTSGGVFYYSTDNGYNWKKDNSTGIKAKIKYLRFIGDKLYIITSLNIYYQDEAGNWTMCESEYLPDGSRDYLVDFNDKIITYSRLKGRSTLVSSSDGGLTWELFGNCNFFVRQLFVKGQTLIANTNFGIKYSLDSGKTWQDGNKELFYADTRYSHNNLQIANNNNEYLTAQRNRMINNTIMKSYDNGNTWVPKIIDPDFTQGEQTMVTKDWYSVVQTKWGVFAINGLGHVYKTEDFGETWQLFSKTSSGVLLDTRNLYELNDTLFYYYKNTIYYSVDKGVTFELLDFNYGGNLPVGTGLWCVSDGTHYADSKDFKLYRSQNNGYDWEFLAKLDFDTTASPPTLNFVYGDNIFFTPQPKPVVPVEYTTYVMNAFDKSVREIALPVPKMMPTVWTENNGNIYAFYVEYNQYRAGIYVSKDTCRTWEYISEGLEDKKIIDMFPAGDYLFVTTTEGMYKTVSSPAVSVVEDRTIYPIQLYPNPTNETVYLKNNIYNIKNILVYDILGAEYKIDRFSNNSFDVNALNRGVYIAKIIFEGDWFITKKFIKK